MIGLAVLHLQLCIASQAHQSSSMLATDAHLALPRSAICGLR